MLAMWTEYEADVIHASYCVVYQPKSVYSSRHEIALADKTLQDAAVHRVECNDIAGLH